jgi:hypothetical protein
MVIKRLLRGVGAMLRRLLLAALLTLAAGPMSRADSWVH